MILNGYICQNEEKVDRAIHGSVVSQGRLEGGVGEDASDEAKLAEYDRLGGLITTAEGRKVKTGSFWDLEKKVMRKNPEVILIMRDLEGNTVEIPEEEALTPELMAAEKIANKKKAEKQAAMEEKERAKAEKKAAKKAKQAE